MDILKFVRDDFMDFVLFQTLGLHLDFEVFLAFLVFWHFERRLRSESGVHVAAGHARQAL